MSQVVVRLTNICAGGNHFTFGITGDVVSTVKAETADISDVITTEDKTAFLKILIKLAKIGRSNNQVKTLFQSGVTVNV